jgi:glucose-6-phosphate dehydrogenase assembly protein OpcA
MGVVADVERALWSLRCEDSGEQAGAPELRASTMTHVVWAPPEWLTTARATFAGLHERHPARTIFLVPQGGSGECDASAALEHAYVDELSREVYAEVIEIRLRGVAARHPASVLLPLLVPDLPAFCRWRGEPSWSRGEFDEVVGAVDRLIVDSGEWRGLPASYGRLAARFEGPAVSDVAFARLQPWRIRLAALWPGIRRAERLRVQGPRAEALLLAGWLRSRLRREITLSRRDAEVVEAVWIDGDEVEPPLEQFDDAAELLSAELDVFGRDPVYEAAALRAAQPV